MLTPAVIDTLMGALDKAKQLVDVATDWNLDEVEIDGEMIRTYSLNVVFDQARAALEAMQEGVWLPVAGPIFVQPSPGVLFRFTANRCELVGGDSGENYPLELRLCQWTPAQGLPLEIVLREVTDWQHAQFPHRTAHSIATHLLEEATELHREPTDAEEMADVLMLLAGLAHFNGIDLAQAVRAKLDKNKARIWGKPDEHGVVKHVQPAQGQGE